jgi:uncharacterized protein
MYIRRELEKEIMPFLKRKEALAIVGPRQAGKTTFLEFLQKHLKEKKKNGRFFTFEKRADLELFQDSIEDFKDIITEYEYVVIDEFQYAKEGGQKLKYLYDTTKVKFIVSGSSSLDLTLQTGKYMVGRMLYFSLFPLSFREFLSMKDKELFGLLEQRLPGRQLFQFSMERGFGNTIHERLAKMLEAYVVYGGYPAVVISSSEQEKKKVLEGITEQYLLREIRGLLHLATEDELLRLSKLLAAQIGNMITYEELSNASGLQYKEVRRHLQVLEKTFIIQLILPFFVNRRTELTKNPKAYFFDMGMRNFLLSDFRDFPARNDKGALMENYALTALSRYQSAQKLKYWRTKSKAEVDFIVEHEQQVYPIEIKYISKRVIGKSLHSFIDKFSPKTAFVLTRDYFAEEQVKNTAVKFMPLTYI